MTDHTANGKAGDAGTQGAGGWCRGMSFVSPSPDQIEQAVTYLASRWPTNGRHLACRPLAGGLLRQVDLETAERVVSLLAERTKDEEADKRITLVKDTAEALQAKQPVSGWPKLAEQLGRSGKPVVREFRLLLGLAISLQQLAAHKQLPVDFLQGLGLVDLELGNVGIPYRDGSGKTIEVKQRVRLSGNTGSLWPKGKPLLVYGEDRLGQARRSGYLVLVEGESDCWTLWFHGEPALGIPGVEAVAKTLQQGHVACVRTIYVLQETDAGGQQFVANVRQRLAALGWQGTLKVVALGDAKDPSELHCRNPQGFKGAWERALEQAGVAEVGSAAPGRTPPVRRVDPYRPFPVDALPEPVRSYIAQSATALHCDPAFVALPVLSVLASLIGNTRVIRLKRGWEEPAVIWSVVVGDSGTLKTPAFKKAVGYLYRLQKRLLKELRQKVTDHDKELEAYKERKRKAKEEDKPFDEEPPEKPTLERVICSDTTVEKLAEILQDNLRRPLVARDELAGWLGSFTRYKQQGNTDLPNWLQMHQAGTVIVDRKTSERPTLFIENAAVSVTGGIQPGALCRALTREYMEAGLPARLLYAMPPRKAKRWSEDEVDPDVVKSHETLLDKLAALDFDRDDEGEKVPFAVKLTAEAKAAWVAFYNEWANEQAAVEGDLASAFSKLEAYAARFALLHHVVSHTPLHHRSDPLDAPCDCDPVEVVSMQAGITLARWFAYEARRVYGTLSETLEERDTRKLVEFIQARGGRITPRQLMRGNCRKYPSVEAAEAALNALGQAGCGAWKDSPTGPQGGRPTRVFELCMTHDTTDTTPDPDEGEEGGGNEGLPRPPHDTSPTRPGGSVQIPGDSGGSVSCVMRHAGEEARASANDGADGQPSLNGTASDRCVMRSWLVPVVGDSTGTLADQGAEEAEEEQLCADARCVDLPPDSSQPTSPAAYRLITSADDLPTVAAAIEETNVIGIDVETTGLDPRTDRVRILSLACDTIDGGRFAYLVDCLAVDPAPLFDALRRATLLNHNLQFDLTFLARLGLEPGTVHDTMLLSQLVHGPRKPKGFHSLGQVAQRELGEQLPKELQRSDWSGALSAAQLEYAARDVLVLLPLFDALSRKVQETGQERVAEIERRCLPAVAWLAGAGVPFDRGAWETLADEAEQEAEGLAQHLDAIAPPRNGYLSQADAWNWSSNDQVKEAFRAAGIDLESTEDDALAAVDHPLAALLRHYRAASKLASTYGRKWLKHVAPDGRVYAEWRQLGCITGRMSSGSPNLQNLPGDERYRRCFRAPEGRMLVRADYSQIELRIAARISGDKALLEAYRTGQDVHTLTARTMTGKQDVTAAERKLAKPVNFGLIYGLSAKTLRKKALAEYGVSMTEEDAQGYKAAFFKTYGGINRWHGHIRRRRQTEVRTLAGRRFVVGPDDFYGAKANYTVQGTGGDGLKLALALLWERRHEAPGAVPVLAVHDEIVVECAAKQAEPVAAWLKTAMVDGMAPLIDPVPVEVETSVGQTWGGD